MLLISFLHFANLAYPKRNGMWMYKCAWFLQQWTFKNIIRKALSRLSDGNTLLTSRQFVQLCENLSIFVIDFKKTCSSLFLKKVVCLEKSVLYVAERSGKIIHSDNITLRATPGLRKKQKSFNNCLNRS